MIDMGVLDKLAEKILGRDEANDYSHILKLADGCHGEESIAGILKKIIPC